MPSNRFIATPLVALSSLFVACTGGCKAPRQSFDYVPLSRFTIDSDALAPGTAVQIVAFSGGKQSTKDMINYLQFIVVNEQSEDTVRVLTALINVPGDTDNGIYTSPALYDGNKGIHEATFEPSNRQHNKLLKLFTATGGNPGDMEAIEEFVSDTSNAAPGDERVAVNKALGLPEHTSYKTTIGILKFTSVPW